MKIVSYSLFGSSPRYTVNALINADLCNDFYPDWICRIYYDNTVPNNVLDKLRQKSNVNLVFADGRGHYRRMWRFYGYDDCEFFMSRDIDSHITEREKSAVDDWLSSGKSLHIMRDHKHHKNKIQAGMFGLRKTNKINNLKDMCIKFSQESTNYSSMDEKFLDQLYPIFKNDVVVHDDYNHHDDKTNNWRVPVNYTDEHGQFVGRSQYPPSININIFKIYENNL